MYAITPEAGGEYRVERRFGRGLLTLRDAAAKALRKGPDHALVWDKEDALTIPVHAGPVTLTVQVLAASPPNPGEADDPESAHTTLNRHTLEPDFRGMIACPSGVLLVGDGDHADELRIGAGRWHVTVGVEPRDLPAHVEVWLARGLSR